MRQVHPRLALLLTAGLLALLAVPGSAAPPLRCGTADTVTPWQSLPVPSFPGVQNVSTTDVVQTYSVDPRRPERLLATNGTTVQASASDGCSWRTVLTLDAQPATAGYPSGLTAQVQSLLLLPDGRGLTVLRDGTGSAARARVLTSDDPVTGAYEPGDSGLPPQGLPGALAASADGRTVFLSVLPVADGATGPVTVPPLPTLPVAVLPTSPPVGLLYASTDGGHTWSARTTTAAVTTDQRNLTALAVDSADPRTVYAVAGGTLLVSRDGGASFAGVPVPGLGTARALATGGPGEVTVSGSGGSFGSRSGVTGLVRFSQLAATSLALRPADNSVAVVGQGLLALVDRTSGAVSAVRSNSAPGQVLADRSAAPTFHALAGHRLLRYVDPTSSGGGPPAALPVAGDLAPPTPRPGVLTPGALHLVLPPGGQQVQPYQLALPADPTPLNVFFLVDVSSTLADFQSSLNASIRQISEGLTRKGMSLRVGLGTLGTGPSRGKPPYPDASAPQSDDRPYRKPTLYHLLRRLGPVDDQFFKAISLVQTETLPNPNVSGDATGDAEEGQLLSMEQAVNPAGVLDPTSTAAVPQYLVPGGQEAGFQADPFARNVLVTPTDEYFANPIGSPDLPSGKLDFDRVIADLNAFQVHALGVTMGSGASDFESSYPDLARVARGTGALAPAGGIRCGDSELIPAGAPIVCTNPDDFGGLLTSVLGGLQDVQHLGVRVTGDPRVLSVGSLAALDAVDVTKASALPLSVTYSCRGLAAGTYTTGLETTLRGFVVGSTSTVVDCSAAAVPPLARVVLPAGPAVAATLPLAPLPVLPPASVGQPQIPPQGQAQAQAQAQPQAQVQPVSAAALQEQQQLQLALVTQQAGTEEGGGVTALPLAMVDRRRRDEPLAVALLATSIVLCSAFGLARLRHQPATRPGRAR